MHTLTIALALIVCLIHVYIVVLEMLWWDTPKGHKDFGARENPTLEQTLMGAGLEPAEREVLAGMHPGREHEDEITVFDSVGFALEDYTVLRYVLQQAEKRGMGAKIDLVPWVEDDPKDLFSHTRGRAGKSRIRRVA